jgi:endonuclease/exonuclease/phosphatase family metal-dependent hydrolase
MRDGRIDNTALRRALAGTAADVLALQEVDQDQPRSDSVDQAALAAEAIGAAEHRMAITVHGTPGEHGWIPADPQAQANGASPRPGPAFGIALASRIPVTDWHVLTLPPAPGRWPLPIPPTRPGGRPGVVWLRDEPRAVLAAVLEPGPGRPAMTVACTHLSFVPGSNLRQLRRARRWLTGLPAPRILLGDLNLPGGLPARITRWTSLARGETFPSPAPRVQLDHVLAHALPDGARHSGQAVRLAVSDHCALVVDLHLP